MSNRNKIIVILFIAYTFSVSISFAQQRDSLWSVLILKKGNNPEMRDNMAEYNPSGFFLFRNCFYDLEFDKGKRKTVRLIDIKQDTLMFIGISKKQDVNPTLSSTDTLIVDYRDIKTIHLIKGGVGSSKKVKCDKYYFIFSKTEINHWIDSKYVDNVFEYDSELTELVPKLSAHGVTYHFEYNGNLYNHSGINIQTQKYSDEEKLQALNGIMTVLDIIVNKRVNITIQRK